MVDDDIQTSREVLDKVSNALMLVAKGDPMVSLRSELRTQFKAIDTQFDGIKEATKLVHDDYVRVPTQVTQAVQALREIIEAKLAGTHDVLDAKIDNVGTRLVEMNRAIVLLQTITDRTPDFVRDQVGQLRQLHDEKITAAIDVLSEKIKSLSEVVTQQFKSVFDTFSEKDKAVSVGLSTQSASAAATQEFNSAATAKMEDNFTTLLNQGREILAEYRKSTDMQLQDIKSRLDKGEGMRNVSDPQMSEAMRELVREVRTLRSSDDRGSGGAAAAAAAAATQRAASSQMIAIISAVIAGLVLLAEITFRAVH